MERFRHTRWLLMSGLFVVVAAFFGCSTARDPWANVTAGPPRVLVSFPPLYSFAANVGGDGVGVLSLLGQQGPHEYEPTAEDPLKVRKANLVLLNGLGLDDFMGRIIKQSDNPKVKVVRVGEVLEETNHDLLRHMEEDHAHHHGHAHKHGEHDPHIWLGIPQAVAMVDIIKEALQKQDPGNKDVYEKNAAAYTKELNELHDYGKKQFAGKKNRKLITMHEALGYFADSFNLEIVGSIQLRPGLEADASQLKKLVNLCKKEGVRVIAVEPQYPVDAARNLQDQLRRDGIELQIVEVDPLETAPPGFGADYYTRKMRENIDNLAKSLP